MTQTSLECLSICNLAMPTSQRPMAKEMLKFVQCAFVLHLQATYIRDADSVHCALSNQGCKQQCKRSINAQKVQM